MPDLPEAAQVQDRVADLLARAVEGDEPPSVGAVDVGPQQPQPVQQGAGVGFVPDPGGVDRRVLTQQQGMSWTGPDPVYIDLLQPQTLLVGHQAQADHLHRGPAELHPDLEQNQNQPVIKTESMTVRTSRRSL